MSAVNVSSISFRHNICFIAMHFKTIQKKRVMDTTFNSVEQCDVGKSCQVLSSVLRSLLLTLLMNALAVYFKVEIKKILT